MSDRMDDAPETEPAEVVIEVNTAITTDDWVDFALHNARDYYGPRRLRGLAVGLATLGGAFVFGGWVGWATGRGPPPSLRDLLFLEAPAGAAVPALFCLGLFAALVVGRYVFYDRLLRRRYRRWAAREHGSQPLAFRCRLDASGFTAINANGHAHKGWSSLVSLEETERQFFLIGRSGHGTPIPKRGYSAADQDRLRTFVLAHLSERAGEPNPGIPALSPDAVAAAAVVARYEQTPRDRATVTLLMWNTAARRRRRAGAAFGTAVGLGVLMVIIDTTTWWLGWREQAAGEPLASALQMFARSEVAGFGPQALYAVGVGFVLWAALPWLLRRQAMAMSRSRGVMPVQIAFGSTGVLLAAPGTTFRYGWAEVLAVLEGPEHIGLLLPLSVILPVPKRALDVADLLALRSLLVEHVSPR